jgi:hypothetical protein
MGEEEMTQPTTVGNARRRSSTPSSFAKTKHRTSSTASPAPGRTSRIWSDGCVSRNTPWRSSARSTTNFSSEACQSPLTRTSSWTTSPSSRRKSTTKKPLQCQRRKRRNKKFKFFFFLPSLHCQNSSRFNSCENNTATQSFLLRDIKNRDLQKI